MTVLHAFWLSVIQAITEFLPVSSSAHLRLFRAAFMPDLQVDLRYDLFLHIGTLLAVILFYREKIGQLLRSFFIGLRSMHTPGFWQSSEAEGVYYALMLIIATVPTVLLGLLFREWIETDAVSTRMIGALLLLNAGVLLVGHVFSKAPAVDTRQDETEAPIQELKPWHALVIGVAQGFAVFPGISRSGSTIATALLCRQNRERAVEFSFFLSLIAVAGAVTLELVDGLPQGVHMPVSVWPIGFVITLVGGLLSLAGLRYVVKKGGLQYFALYCVLIGALTMWFT